MLVGEDFELICWDVVTMPFTIGSWMYNNEEDTKQHIDKKPHIKDEELGESMHYKQQNSGNSLNWREKLKDLYNLRK